MGIDLGGSLAVRMLETESGNHTDHYLQARIPPDRLVSFGEELWLSLNQDKLHFFDPDTELAIFPTN